MQKDKNQETIAASVFAAAKKHPEAIALSCNGQELTYAQLNTSALKLAALIRAKGIIHQNIGIYAQKSFSAYCGVLGVLYAGCSYVPLNPKHPLPRIMKIIKSADISSVICDELPIDGVENLIYPTKDLDGVSPLMEPVDVSSQSLAYIMFTSGSTGEPKGVMVTQSNVCNHIRNMTEMYGFSVGDRCSQTFDLSFDPSVSDMFCAWFNGAALCALSFEDMYCPSDYIQREGITFWASVPTLGNFMNKLGKLEEGAFPRLKYSTFCGEPFPQLLAHQWAKAAPNSTIENLYGPTEATVYVTRHIYRQDEHERKYSNNIVPIGRPLPGQSAVIVDEHLVEVAEGKVGELCVSGPQITSGYLKDDAKTKAVFVSMPWDQEKSRVWYRTGDLAFVNALGDIECLGRIDSQIKIGGQRVELGEIEAVVREAVNHADVAVVPSSYENGVPQKLVAFITKELDDADREKIRVECQKKLLSVFVPRNIYSLEALPLNPSGKIDRLSLKNLAIQMDK